MQQAMNAVKKIREFWLLWTKLSKKPRQIQIGASPEMKFVLD